MDVGIAESDGVSMVTLDEGDRNEVGAAAAHAVRASVFV